MLSSKSTTAFCFGLFLIASKAAPLSNDPAILPAVLNESPGAEYSDAKRLFQGIPGIERAPNGRLWAVWYSGDTREGPKNYVILATSADGGRTWSGPRLVIDPPGFVRAFDGCLWLDPKGRLWLFWAQAAGHWDGRGGVWASYTTRPGDENPRWSAPRRISDGVLMNKPIVSSRGEWLLPVAFWSGPPTLPIINERDKLNLTPAALKGLMHDLGDRKGIAVVSSRDEGQSFPVLGTARPPGDIPAGEHMLIERKDGTLWMLARTRAGIISSVSSDGGRTWSTPVPSGIPHPPTRFFVGKLRSGNLLLVRNNPPNGTSRSHLTAFLSDDEGKTWKGALLLDERGNVSYPDATEMPDGTIHVVYDRDRFTDREILIATFRESDVIAKKFHAANSRSKGIVNRAGVRSPAASLPEAPDLKDGGWTALINGRDMGGWKPRGEKNTKWFATDEVYWNEAGDPTRLVASPRPGPLLVNGDDGRTTDLLTEQAFGDSEIYLEFMIPRKSNSGVYVHGLYELQILDSFGVKNPGVHDCGAIYERWIDNTGVGGAAPLKNASRRPGEWQSFHIQFRAPRFNSAGQKTEPARFLRVVHNGVLVHENVAVDGPTRASMEYPEAPTNPLMIQGDHGPVALRNVCYRPSKTTSRP
jgi:predicted neuraminidase